MIDFKKLNAELLSRARSLLPDWLPGGQFLGDEYLTSNIGGGNGQSLRFNISKGCGKDFATGQTFADMISLYAAINNLTQGNAAKQLSDAKQLKAPAIKKDAVILTRPPHNISLPSCVHHKHGQPSAVYEYRDEQGLLFLIARYDLKDGGKSFSPWSWSVEGKWVQKACPAPRPLYKLDQLAARPNVPVLLVEGEKACDAAIKFAGDHYVVMTWPGGAQAIKQIDWSPLRGRHVLIWPDADEPGIKAANDIAFKLYENVASIKILDVTGLMSGSDAADFDIDWPTFLIWAKPRAKVYEPPIVAKVPETLPMAKEDPPLPDDVDEPEDNIVNLWSRLELVKTKKLGPVVNVDNVVRILEKWNKVSGLVWFDEFYNRVRTKRDTGNREWTDIDDIELCLCLQRDLYINKMTIRTVQDAVNVFAYKNRRNEPLDWFETLSWDSERRIDDFFIRAFGADDNEYSRAASRNWWTAMVARIYKPGCKFDNMVVLEGRQGAYKSTALSIVGGDWFMETSEVIGTKDFLQSLNGKLVVEIAELDSFSKVDIRSIKKTISCQVDTYRASFGRRAQDYARRCVFVGTTNEDEYLEDATGGRRFWPIRTTNIDLDYIRASREQLFAEAVVRFKSGADWWTMPELAEREQEMRRRGDAWEDAIFPWLCDKEKVRLLDIAIGALDFQEYQFDKRAQMRLGAAMRSLGWIRTTSWNGKKAEKIWERGQNAEGKFTDEKAMTLRKKVKDDQEKRIMRYPPSSN